MRATLKRMNTRQIWIDFRRVGYGALAGGVGGAIGWLPGEFLAMGQPTNPLIQYSLIILYFVVVGGCIGATIGAVDDFFQGLYRRASSAAQWGALLGVIGGAVGSLPGEWTFQALSGLGLTLVGRAIGWAIVGVFIGVTQGVINRDRVRLLRGGIGGLLGGYVGGGCFELVSQALTSGAASRWIAAVILGLFLGALIVFIQTWLSDARLVVISAGPQEGARLDLTKPVTILGRGDRDDFVLYAGEGIQPAHARIVLKPNGYWIQPMRQETPVYVNQQLTPSEQHLHHESLIRIGSLQLRFTEQTRPCPVCATENPARARFCRKCGRGLGVG